MNEPVFILKGNVVYSKNKDELRILKDHYLISESGLVKGANYAQTECQFRYCGTAIPFLTVRSTAR